MTESSSLGPTRRSLLLGGAATGSALLLGGCVGGGSSSAPGTQASATGDPNAPVTLQSDLADPSPKKALAAAVAGYSGGKVTINTIATEQFRAQLSTYLTSDSPPDVLTWLAGSVTRDYARKGLLLDVSDLWTGDGPCAGFTPALKALSTDDEGKQVFVPTSYYWWSIFYRKSQFAKWGLSIPTTWDAFIQLCETLKSKGVSPLTNGIGPTPWMASGWFDYLDLRVNGATFHRDLLAGKHSFDSAEVQKVMGYYKQLLPFFHPSIKSWDQNQAVTPLVTGKAAMYLVGTFLTDTVPKSMLSDIDFFSVPTIDPKIPSAEEAPTDGYFASVRTKNPAATKKLLTYLATAKQQQTFVQTAGGQSLPTTSDIDKSKLSPLVQKGLKLLADTKDITQYFNRDSSDAVQTTADAALTKFYDHPDQLSSILKTWQQAATQARNS